MHFSEMHFSKMQAWAFAPLLHEDKAVSRRRWLPYGRPRPAGRPYESVAEGVGVDGGINLGLITQNDEFVSFSMMFFYLYCSCASVIFR